jgi:hypothetical protein
VVVNRQELFQRIGQQPNREGKVLCPVHGDHTPSLSVKDGDRAVVLKCWVCNAPVQQICAAWGIAVSDLFYEQQKQGRGEPIAVYDYGTYEVLRYPNKGKDKVFSQRHKDPVTGEVIPSMKGVTRLLYRQGKVDAAVAAEQLVVVVEGEKDVHTLERIGYVATTASGGSNAPWEPWFTKSLVGARVAVIPDNDHTGRAYAQKIVTDLEGRTPVKLIELDGLPEKGDVSDWLPMHSAEELERLIDEAFQPKTKARRREDVFASALDEIRRYQDGQIVGLPWPVEWPTVSRAIGPIVPGVLTVIGAKTSHGKSIAAQQIARRVCQVGKSVLMVTLELTPERLISRELASNGADIKRLRTRDGMTADDYAAISRFQEDMGNLGEQWYLSTPTMEEIDYEIGILKPDIVIIDYLHRLHRNGKDEYHSITNNMNDAQDITLRHNVPVVILSQLRRPGAAEEYSRPHMSDLRGSGAIEERAATILLLHRMYEADERTGKRVKTDKGVFYIAKNADGDSDLHVRVVFRDGRFLIQEELR